MKYEDWAANVHARIKAEPIWKSLMYQKACQYFLRIALGSARESKGWYQRGHHLLTAEVLDHRLALLDEIIALLVTELNLQKQRAASAR